LNFQNTLINRKVGQFWPFRKIQSHGVQITQFLITILGI
jgi:hypothetical protein